MTRPRRVIALVSFAEFGFGDGRTRATARPRLAGRDVIAAEQPIATASDKMSVGGRRERSMTSRRRQPPPPAPIGRR